MCCNFSPDEESWQWEVIDAPILQKHIFLKMQIKLANIALICSFNSLSPPAPPFSSPWLKNTTPEMYICFKFA